jgi:hypothetical protein
LKHSVQTDGPCNHPDRSAPPEHEHNLIENSSAMDQDHVIEELASTERHLSISLPDSPDSPESSPMGDHVTDNTSSALQAEMCVASQASYASPLQTTAYVFDSPASSSKEQPEFPVLIPAPPEDVTDFLPAQADNSMSHHEASNPTTSINVIMQSPPMSITRTLAPEHLLLSHPSAVSISTPSLIPVPDISSPSNESQPLSRRQQRRHNFVGFQRRLAQKQLKRSQHSRSSSSSHPSVPAGNLRHPASAYLANSLNDSRDSPSLPFRPTLHRNHRGESRDARSSYPSSHRR